MVPARNVSVCKLAGMLMNKERIDGFSAVNSAVRAIMATIPSGIDDTYRTQATSSEVGASAFPRMS